MKIARIDYADFKSEEAADAVIAASSANKGQAMSVAVEEFESAITLETGPLTRMNITIYPSQEAADKTLSQRQKFIEDFKEFFVEGTDFYYEGEILEEEFSNKPRLSEKPKIDQLQEQVNELQQMIREQSSELSP